MPRTRKGCSSLSTFEGCAVEAGLDLPEVCNGQAMIYFVEANCSTELNFMRRKDGQKKLRARRSVAVFTHGFREHPNTLRIGNPLITGHAKTSEQATCVSLFSGCGGLDLGMYGGFHVLGKNYCPLPFSVLRAYDIDAKAVQTYNLNLGNHAVHADLTQISSEALPKANILLGGFPCQDFSSSGPKTGLAGARGMLYKVMVGYMLAHKPAIVIAENVLFLEKLRDGEILRTILNEFEQCGYKFRVWHVCCQDFGLPQSRTRLFLVGVRSDLTGFPKEPTAPVFTNHTYIDDAIGDLVAITDETVPNQSQFFVATVATKGAGQGDQKSEAGKLAYTVRANARARIHFHYSLDRRLTVRECARLQSFPDEFVFPHSAMQSMSEIGNAVPPIIGHLVGSSVAEYLAKAKKGIRL